MKKRQRERAKRTPVPEKTKDKVIRFRVTKKDYQEIHRAAKEEECTVSLFIVECVRYRINGLV